MRSAMSIVAIATASLAGNAAARPSWAIDSTLRQSGDKLTAVCQGVGPAEDIARTEAMNSCKSTAAQALTGEANISTLVVNTESDSAFHEEVKSSALWSGLICKPARESIEESDTKITVFIECVFDLRGVQKIEDKSATETAVRQAPKRLISSETIAVSLATVPACESVLIGGRVIRCTTNPLSLLIKPTDTHIILRATGYKPKTIDADDLRRARNATIVFD